MFILCIYFIRTRNMRKRRTIIKEVEVDRGTAAKSVPIPISYFIDISIYLQKRFEGHRRTVRYHYPYIYIYI